MKPLRSFEVRLSGTRDAKVLHPEAIDVDEMIAIMQHGRDLLYPDGKKKEKVSVQVTEGSVVVSFLAAAGRVIEVQALMEEVEQSRDLGLLAPKQREAITYFQEVASKNEFTIDLGATGKPDTEKLHITRNSAPLWKQPIPTWVDAELFLSGKITNIGGKFKPNIHLDTDDYDLRTVIIAATEQQLAADTKNRLYKLQQVRIRIQQDVETGAYDPRSARLINFIDPEDTQESDEEYLDRLIREATPSWSRIVDSDNWLKEIRGYED
jgi:hypothetical protein